MCLCGSAADFVGHTDPVYPPTYAAAAAVAATAGSSTTVLHPTLYSKPFLWLVHPKSFQLADWSGPLVPGEIPVGGT